MPDFTLFAFAEHLGSALQWLGQADQLLAQAGDAVGDAAQGAGADAVGDAGAGDGQPGQGQPGPPGAGPGDQPSLIQQILRNPLTLFAGLMFLFYLIVLAPERRKQAEVSKRRSALKKNDRVVTTGGIIGTVVGVNPDSEEVTLRVDDSSNTRIRVLRSAIGTIQTASKDKPSKEKEDTGKS